MTTEINTATEYISMADSDGTRSVADLINEEAANGYKNMTDKEISKLIEYKTYKAKQDESIKLVAEQVEQHNAELKSMLQTALDSDIQLLNKAINTPVETTIITGNEVN